MIVKIDTEYLHPAIATLLSYATSTNKIKHAYDNYIQHANKILFAFMQDDQIIGCIGVEVQNQHALEILHIAVTPEKRSSGIGSTLLKHVIGHFPITTITAETDNDAVLFYQKFGFDITSLGEKYVGVERFLCIYNIKLDPDL